MRRRLLALVVLAGLLLSGCASGPPAPSRGTGRVNLVAGENFWGNIAGQIGGDRVSVTSIVANPSTDPHLYESNAANAVAVAQADIVVVNGLGYDDFMNRLVAASGRTPFIVSAQEVLGVKDPTANPHLWYDVERVPQVAGAIKTALVRVDPARAAAYSANLMRFDQDLAPARAVVAKIKAKYPGAPVAYTERLPAYLLADAGLVSKTPTGFASAIENGTEPNPADTQAMRRLISTRQVRLLLYNTQTVSATTSDLRTLAQRSGVPVIGLTETMPRSYPTYQAWMLDEATHIFDALGG